MANKKPKPTPQRLENNNAKPNIWGMFRDIGVASINKGQFMFFCFFGLIAILLLRMPANEIPNLLRSFGHLLERTKFWGWALFVIVTMCWYFNAKYLRKVHQREMARMAKEKAELQEQLSGRKMITSNRVDNTNA